MKRASASADAYVFGSTRIRALEISMLDTERMARLLEAGNLDNCVNLLEELGVDPIYHPETGEFDREKTLELRLRRAYDEVLSLTEQAEFLKLWLYPYDCNNIKAVIKCAYRGADTKDMLFDFGIVPIEQLKDMALRGDYSALPAPFGEAAEEAARALAATANPQTVDLILDAACYQAMRAQSDSCGVPFARELVGVKIDLTNLLICLRRIRMSDRYVSEIFPRSFYVEGGSLEYAYLADLCAGGEAYFWERLEYSPYEKLTRSGGRSASLMAVELTADEIFMDQVCRARAIPYGAEPLLGYLLGVEYEVKNLRILLSGYSIGLSPKNIRERMRIGYV